LHERICRRSRGVALPFRAVLPARRRPRTRASVSSLRHPMTLVSNELVGAARDRPKMGGHRVAAARADLARGVSRWRLWLLLGLNDIRQRYQRSRVGQFWITLSML